MSAKTASSGRGLPGDSHPFKTAISGDWQPSSGRSGDFGKDPGRTRLGAYDTGCNGLRASRSSDCS